MIVPLAQLTPGMVLEEDVRNHVGQVLLGAGVAIEARHLGMLRTWGITIVRVRSDAVADAKPVTREQIEAAANDERQRFRHCDLGDPAVRALWNLAVKRRVARQP